MHFTATPSIPAASNYFKLFSINGTSIVEQPYFTTDLTGHLRTL